MTTSKAAQPGRVSPRGRRRDPRLDTAILDAALEVVAEVGYAATTVAAVVERAGAGKAAVYRRWESKKDLVLAAVQHLQAGEATVSADPPDTGSLRGDLVALSAPTAATEQAQKLRVVRGLSSMLSAEPELAEAVGGVIVAPWTAAMRVLLARAVERGEAQPQGDLDVLAQVLPSMAAYRVIVGGEPIDQEFLMTLADNVLLPALNIRSTPPRRSPLRGSRR
ncbi:TetR/AcrR family transcriptional regulator [Williamsia sp. M5A3_1d]